MNQELSANSIIEIIKHLKSIHEGVGEEEYFYRGQNKRYCDGNSEGILANVFRSDITNPELDGRAVKEFYQYTGLHLNSDERKNYLAYCQHHGLKTNLVDVTRDPLAALYFAIMDDQSNNGDDAVLYVFKKSNMLDITDLIIDFPFGLDLMDRIGSGDESVIYRLVEYIKRFGIRINPYLGELIKAFQAEDTPCSMLTGKIHTIENPTSDSEYNGSYETGTSIKAIEILKKDEEVCEEINKFIRGYLKYYRKEVNESNIQSIREAINNPNPFPYYYIWYVYMLKEYLKFGSGNLTRNNENLRFIPNMYYSPTVYFDRMALQSGLFIYQCCFWGYRGRRYICEIIPDEKIILRDKETIKQELELLGIEKFRYYGDVDMLAKKLNKKYYPCIDDAIL